MPSATPQMLTRRLLACVPMLAGAAALAGWGFGIPVLMSILPGLTKMKANAALCFVAAGAGLLLLDEGADPEGRPIRRFSAALLGAVPLLAGVLTLMEYRFGLSFGIDQALFTDPYATTLPFPGRMAPATAIGQIGIGAGLLLLAARGRSHRAAGTHSGVDFHAVAAHCLAAVPGSIGYVALAGYTYDIYGQYNPGRFVPVALNTALALTAMAAALLLTRPDRGWRLPFKNSPVTRLVLVRLVPAALLMPFLSFAAVVAGARQHLYDPRYGPALFAMVAAASSVGMAILGALAVRRAERRLHWTSAALQASEERLRIAQSAGRIGTFEWYPETGQVNASDEYRRIYGLPGGQDVPVSTLRDLVHPQDQQQTAMARLDGADNPLRHAEYRIMRADTGEERWIARRGEPVLTETASGAKTLRFVGVAFDVTDRKRAEAALVESEARFRTLVEAMPQLAFMALPNGHVEFRNQRWCDYTGVPNDEGARARWLETLHPDDRAMTLAGWKHALLEGSTYQAEHRLRDAAGRFRWFLTRAVPVRDAESGAIAGWFGTSTDISDIVQARETLARSREELERIVADRTRVLAETQARLAQARRMEALGQLAGGIAHDFNNVIQAILGGAALVERRADDAERVRALAHMIQNAASRGASVTSRLLTFSRQSDLRAEAVDAAGLLAGMREILTHTLGAGVSVTAEILPEAGKLLADRGQLETVLVNLATNARDAMHGKGSLRMQAALEIVAVQDAGRHRAGLKPGRYVVLAVSDNGDGMTPEVLARASEPFFTTKPPGSGTGLGLAMARGLAEQSGGGLEIESAAGQGTTIRLWLPAVDDHCERLPGPPPPGHTPAPRPARLLMVDDDQMVRETLTAQMEAAGYAVLAAATGADALAMLDAGQDADLIVSDLSMPGMDGLAVIREVHRRRPKLPAILLTGFATTEAGMAMEGSGGGSFTLLRKPILGTVLAERVALMLDAAALA